jgi:polysaccharide export outer membrane protein
VKLNRTYCKKISLVLTIALLTSCGTNSAQKKPSSKSIKEKEAVFKKIQNYTVVNPEDQNRQIELSQHNLNGEDYKIGFDDVLDISVYGESDISKVQRVRPDGHISLPLIGDIRAHGKTPIELRNEIAERLSKYILRPKVTVVIADYQSKKVAILGEVVAPGLLRLSANIPLIEGLHGAMLIRENQILPVDFYSLLKKGDMSQNIILRHDDTILIPNSSDNKVFILGEVRSPGILKIIDQLSLAEAITAAGGISPTGKHNIFIIRGGFGDPQVFEIDVDKIFEEKDLSQNINLVRGDIIYVPKTVITKINTVLGHVNTFLSTIVLFESAVTQYPATKSVLTKGRLPGTTTITTTTGTGAIISEERPEKP